MRWIHLVILSLCLFSVLSEDDAESNDVSAAAAPPQPKINLDSNLRRALLRALTELENEETSKTELLSPNDGLNERVLEKASAASVSIYSNGDSVTVSPVSSSTVASTIPDRVTVIFQQSQSQPTITEDSENILTSATNNFANHPFGKISQSEKQEKTTNQNSIYNDNKTVTKLQKNAVTTPPPIVSTDESEAKVEDVQFFSAPLVAAFTVHQDEGGLPKKVEPIFRTHIPTKSQEEIILQKEQQIKQAKQQEQAKLAQQQQEKIKLEELKRHQEKLELQEKHKALEEQIYRLNLSLRQQHQIFLKQQEELRVKSNTQSFIPINKPVINQAQQLPFSNQQQSFKQQTSLIQPSVSFNPLIEAGKLPLNAQFLPVKGPVDFRTPFAFNNNFNQQANSNNFNNGFNQQTNNFNSLNNFNQHQQTNSQNSNHQQQTNNINQQNQGNRIFRQNTGLGNFGVNNNFNRNTNTFSIQPAVNLDHFENQAQSNRFFRSNLESSFLQPPHPPPVQNARFFRSNLEGSFSSPNTNVFTPPANDNFQLSNLLYNSGAFRGKSNEDLNLISKVLSLNHVGGNGVSLRSDLRPPFARSF